jgi:soluble lytic murein transglycosylase-like protein
MSRNVQLWFGIRPALAVAGVILAALTPLARAAEHITLRNGFELDCARREITGDRVRLYLLPAAGSAQGASESSNYMEVPASAILRAETIPDLPASAPAQAAAFQAPGARSEAPAPYALSPTPSLTPAEMHQLLARAGTLHNIDADLLASVVHAESNGNVRAVSRAGAQGLMQLMPATASELGVQNSFAPEENIGGGTAYLDAMLTRYHDDIALALAAYNAGPAAVDRYHGIPPYVETRAYVARVIREFNRRKRAASTPAATASPTQVAAR